MRLASRCSVVSSLISRVEQVVFHRDPSLRLEHLNVAAWASIDHEVLKDREDDEMASEPNKAKAEAKKADRITHHLYICVKKYE